MGPARRLNASIRLVNDAQPAFRQNKNFFEKGNWDLYDGKVILQTLRDIFLRVDFHCEGFEKGRTLPVVLNIARRAQAHHGKEDE